MIAEAPPEQTPDTGTSLLRDETSDLVTTQVESTELVVRSVERREIEARLVPWNVVVDTPIGLETFKPGSFAHVDPRRVVLRLEHQDPPAGRGLSLEERADGPYMVFKVSKTPRGDEILTLAADGVTGFVSVGYDPRNSTSELEQRAGRTVHALTRTDLREVSTTWKPYYTGAAITQVRSEGDPVSETVAPAGAETPEAAAPPQAVVPANEDRITAVLESFEQRSRQSNEEVMSRLAAIEERSRADFAIPVGPAAAAELSVTRGEWMQTALRILSGERVSDMQLRSLADIISTDNVGAVPPTYSQELIGVIDPVRRFLNSTRRIDTPTSGMSLVMPKITTRPTAGTQSTEKTQLTSTATSVTTETFDAITKGGAGDISLQLLKRSSPSFLSLYLELLAEAYANEAEEAAIAALFDESVNIGGVIDPEDLSLGDAWVAASALRQQLDTLWMSSAAVGAFIDAKADTTNAPLYSNLAADFTARTGLGGSVSGLRPVWVPALDATAVDVIAGPSRGFAWAEDGSYTLQVDVPAKAGRDVAIVGILWFAPMYPGAFTTYSLGSGS